MRASSHGVAHRRLTGIEIAGLLTVMFLWALCYPFIAPALLFAPPLFAATSRALLAGVLLVVLAVVLRRPRPRGRLWLFALGIGLTETTAGFAAMFLAGGRISPGLATVIASTQPLMAVACARVATRERVGPRGTAAMVVGFGGVAIAALAGDSRTTSTSGVLLVLLAAAAVACGNVLLKVVAEEADAIWMTGSQLLIGAVPLAAAAVATESAGGVRWEWQLFGSIGVLAVFSTAAGFVLWVTLLRRMPLHRANTFNYATPLFALLIAAAFQGERLSAVQWLGCALVGCAAYLAATKGGRSTGGDRGTSRPT